MGGAYVRSANMRMSYAALIAQTTHSSLMAKPTAYAQPSAASPKRERSGHKRHVYVQAKAEEAAVDASLPIRSGNATPRGRAGHTGYRRRSLSMRGYARCGLTEMEALSMALEINADLRQGPRSVSSHLVLVLYFSCYYVRRADLLWQPAGVMPPPTPTLHPPGMIPASTQPCFRTGVSTRPHRGGGLTPPIILLSLPFGPRLLCSSRLLTHPRLRRPLYLQ